MKSYFKTEQIEVDGEKLTIRELSAGDHLALVGAKEDAANIVCARCVAEWKDENVETIRENVPARLLAEIARRVFALSGIELSKNSEPTPDDVSSSA